VREGEGARDSVREGERKREFKYEREIPTGCQLLPPPLFPAPRFLFSFDLSLTSLTPLSEATAQRFKASF
jgi:hypothetical protein